jgi:hypothetical protein
MSFTYSSVYGALSKQFGFRDKQVDAAIQYTHDIAESLGEPPSVIKAAEAAAIGTLAANRAMTV